MRNHDGNSKRTSRVLCAVAAGTVAAMLGASSASGSQFINNFGHGFGEPPFPDSGDHLWSNVNNWNNGIPGAPDSGMNAWINVTVAHFRAPPHDPPYDPGPATINYAAPSPSEIIVGQGGGDGWVLMTDGGSITTSHINMSWGDDRNGFWDQDGGATTITGDLRIGRDAGGTAEFNISGGSLSATHIRLSGLGLADSATAFLNVSGTAEVTTSGQLIVSRQLGDGTATISGGTVNVGHQIQVNSISGGSTATGILNVSGGTLSAGTAADAAGGALDLLIGRGDNPGDAHMTVSGGTVNVPRNLDVGVAGGSGGAGSNTLTISGGSLTAGAGLRIGHNGAGHSGVEITGGDVHITGTTVLSNASTTSSAPGSTLTITGGTFHALQIGVGASEAAATGSGHLTIGGDAVVTTQNHIYLRPNGKGTFTVNGSGADITLNRVGSTGFEVTDGSVMNFNADADGFSTVKIPQSMMRFSGPNGILNVDATEFEKPRIVNLYTFESYFNTGFTTFGEENLETAEGFNGSIVYNPTSIQFRNEWWLPGDATLDGQVNISDLSILAGNWQQSDRFWEHGDFNFDGVVNISDLSILAGNWQAGAGGGPSMSFEEAMAMFDVFNGVVVPEPAAAGLLGVAGLMALRRRRR